MRKANKWLALGGTAVALVGSTVVSHADPVDPMSVFSTVESNWGTIVTAIVFILASVVVIKLARKGASKL